MKRKFLCFCLFFLSACVSGDFRRDTGCPVVAANRRFSVLFEYGSAQLNEKAVRQLQNVAGEVRVSGDYVCLLGREAYRGVPAYQAEGALERVKKVAGIFLKEGVDVRKIYIGISAEKDRIGFDNPQTAADEEHVLDVLIGAGER